MIKTEIKIRFVTKKNVTQLVDLCEAHAIYEKNTYSKKGKVNQLTIDLFSENPKLYCLVVEKERQLMGYATYMKQYATWDTENYIYMDCLFMNEKARGLGLGQKLVNRIKKEGQKSHCNLIQWQTPNFNTRAIKFYNRIGATSKNKERFYLEIN